MRRDSVLRVISKLLLPFIALFGFYVQFHAETGPGGGFQAGVIIGAAIVLYAIMFGLEPAMRIVPVRVVEAMVASGVLIFLGVGVVALLMGGEYLNYSVLIPGDQVHAQELGVHLVELGVLVSVTGAVIAIYYAFAGRGR